MGKFLAITLCGVALLVNPAFADGFNFKTTLYSVWKSGNQGLEIVANPEDDFAHWTNSQTGFDVFCTPTVKKATTAVFNCEGKPLKLRYDKASGTLYANDFAYSRSE